MIRQDYILRMIQQFGDVVAAIAGLKRAGRYEEARSLLAREVQRLAGLNASLVRALSVEDLKKLTSVGDVPDLDRCLVLAHFLREDAEIDEALGNSAASVRSYTKSLDLFLDVFVYHDDKYLVERLPALEAIIARLEPYELPAATLLRVVHLYEKTGKYAQAENVLFELLEGAAGDSDMAAEGVAFYQRLLALDDAELERGNLPRDEVEEELFKLISTIEGGAGSP